MIQRAIKRFLAAAMIGLGAILPQKDQPPEERVKREGLSEGEMAQQSFRKSPERRAMISELKAQIMGSVLSRPRPKGRAKGAPD